MQNIPDDERKLRHRKIKSDNSENSLAANTENEKDDNKKHRRP